MSSPETDSHRLSFPIYRRMFCLNPYLYKNLMFLVFFIYRDFHDLRYSICNHKEALKCFLCRRTVANR